MNFYRLLLITYYKQVIDHFGPWRLQFQIGLVQFELPGRRGVPWVSSAKRGTPDRTRIHQIAPKFEFTEKFTVCLPNFTVFRKWRGKVLESLTVSLKNFTGRVGWGGTVQNCTKSARFSIFRRSVLEEAEGQASATLSFRECSLVTCPVS